MISVWAILLKIFLYLFMPKEGLKIPQHIAIIKDGNRRWAKGMRLPKSIGHKKGAENTEKIVKYCRKLGVKVLTLYVFSSENWRREKSEIQDLMDLLRRYLKDKIGKLAQENDIKVLFIGNRDLLDPDIVQMMSELEEEQKDNDFTLVLALSYGAREEIRRAATNMAEDLLDGKIDQDAVNNDAFDNYLYTSGLPDPELIIRTSGEYRMSNFLLWQAAYSELYFCDVLWPDFKPEHLMEAIEEYNERERRYGK